MSQTGIPREAAKWRLTYATKQYFYRSLMPLSIRLTRLHDHGVEGEAEFFKEMESADVPGCDACDRHVAL